MDELISINNIFKYYPIAKKRKLCALRGVTLQINRGETLGLVGESGSGKSTLARIIMGIEKPTRGDIFYEGKKNLCSLDRHSLRAQIIFQNSAASLDPKMTIESIITEGMEIYKMLDKAGRKQRAEELLTMVGLEKEHLKRYPHEFSGGQKQRISIARALAVNPKFIVCDEAISALDVSVQCNIMNLLNEFKQNLSLTYLFIAHDLNMVNYIADRIAVMYSGSTVELGDSQEVCLHPCHPYTKFLLASILIPDPNQRALNNISTYEPTTVNITNGCAFAALCPNAIAICQTENPTLREVESGHFAACHVI